MGAVLKTGFGKQLVAPHARLPAARTAQPHDHAILVYERDAVANSALSNFFRQGGSGSELSIFIADGLAPDCSLTQGQALTLLSKSETFLRTGAFDPEEMSFFLAKSVERNAGNPVRIASELSWAMESGFNAAKLLAYEQRLQRTVARLPVASLCLYDRRRGSARVLNDALRLHPLVFAGEGVVENPAFVEPLEATPTDSRSYADEARSIRISDLRGLPGPNV